MSKLIYAINLTIDGCCDHTSMVPDDEIMAYHTQLLREAGLLVYGRRTYELMVPYWPEAAQDPTSTHAEKAFADVFNTIGRLVFSRSIDRTDDEQTRFVRTDPAAEIARLKQVPGKDMLIGGVSLPARLMELGLIDEYHFVVHPVLAGAGRRLFDGVSLPERLQLRLVESKIFKSGAVALRYTNL